MRSYLPCLLFIVLFFSDCAGSKQLCVAYAYAESGLYGEKGASSGNLPPSGEQAQVEKALPLSKKDPSGMFATFKKRLNEVWRSDVIDIYVPAYTWHNRLLYDSSKARKYNENPWGGGIGRSTKDEDGDSHQLFIMGFQDSHDRFEPYGGYAFFKNYRLDEKDDWRFGIGYTLGITARHDYDYVPLPLPLPLVSLEYKQLAVQAAYIPGTYNNGNVLFTWLRWRID